MWARQIKIEGLVGVTLLVILGWLDEIWLEQSGDEVVSYIQG